MKKCKCNTCACVNKPTKKKTKLNSLLTRLKLVFFKKNKDEI